MDRRYGEGGDTPVAFVTATLRNPWRERDDERRSPAGARCARGWATCDEDTPNVVEFLAHRSFAVMMIEERLRVGGFADRAGRVARRGSSGRSSVVQASPQHLCDPAQWPGRVAADRT